MTAPDRYTQLVSSGLGGSLAARLRLPRPVTLRRWDPAGPLLPGGALVTGPDDAPLAPIVSQRLADHGVPLRTGEPGSGASDRIGAIVVDACGARHPADWPMCAPRWRRS